MLPLCQGLLHLPSLVAHSLQALLLSCRLLPKLDEALLRSPNGIADLGAADLKTPNRLRGLITSGAQARQLSLRPLKPSPTLRKCSLGSRSSFTALRHLTLDSGDDPSQFG